MRISHHVREENSGLFSTTLEIAEWEQKAGHQIELRDPQSGPYFGNIDRPDIHCIHTQLAPTTYHDSVPKIMFMHGEPLSSVGNGISMKAIVDLAPKCDAFIAMRRKEIPIWSSIKRTWLVRKGIDLEMFHPAEPDKKLDGEPSILYCENWRQTRNPLYICAAMQEIVKAFPKAQLHLYNCRDKRMYDTFYALLKHNKWFTFLRALQGPVEDMNALYNRADIVVSCLYPLYARSIEAFGAGKAFISPGYDEHEDYPWQCTLDVHSMADAVIRCWTDYQRLNYRQWAIDRHNIRDTVDECVAVYERYLP